MRENFNYSNGDIYKDNLDKKFNYSILVGDDKETKLFMSEVNKLKFNNSKEDVVRAYSQYGTSFYFNQNTLNKFKSLIKKINKSEKGSFRIINNKTGDPVSLIEKEINMQDIKQFTESMTFDHPEDPSKEVLVEAGDYYKVNEDGTITLLTEDQIKKIEEEKDKDTENKEVEEESEDEEELNEAEVAVEKIIKDLVDSDLSSTNEEQGKFSEIIKGLAFSNDPKSNAFMKGLDKVVTEYGKEFLSNNKE